MPTEEGIIVPAPSKTEDKKPISPFMYRVIKYRNAEDTELFMPQRGVVAEDGNDLWFDGVPVGAPTLDLARTWAVIMWHVDCKKTKGDVVWVPTLAEGE